MAKRIEHYPGEKIGPYNIEFVKEAKPYISPKGQKKRRGIFICPFCQKKFTTQITKIKTGENKSCGCQCFNQKHVIEIGEKYNKLTVLSYLGVNKHRQRMYECQCDCGNTKIVSTQGLTSGDISSCGCLNRNFLKGQKFGKLTVIDETKDRDSYNRDIMWKCQCDCGNIKYVSTKNLKQNAVQSCGCLTKSSGELKIEQLLIKIGIIYNLQYKFQNCKNKKCLPFDFYLPEYNICIEYDGEQHYKPVDYWGGEEGFKQRQKNDEIKNQYCKDNNIKLIRIPYWDYDKLNEEYLLELINNAN